MTGFMGRDNVYIVAEIGSNHGGSLDAALALIDAAADAGADAAKFQAGHADHVYDPAQFPEEHASFKKYVEPVLDWLPKLAQRCEERGIDFGCSAFCFDSLDAVDPYVKWHKVASIEAGWGLFVRAVSEKRKPVLISTGLMANTEEVDDNWRHVLYGTDVTLLLCAVAYPAPIEDSDLRVLTEWAGEQGIYPERFGLSDHTTHPTIAPCAAVVLGAKVIEKHIRPNLMDVPIDSPHLSRTTPDWSHSLDPAQFRDMVQAIRLTEQALGSSEKRIRESEKPYLKYRRGPRGLRGA